jgi:hypothetical protein
MPTPRIRARNLGEVLREYMPETRRQMSLSFVIFDERDLRWFPSKSRRIDKNCPQPW